MPRTKLHIRTLELLKQDDRSTMDIAQGAEVPYHWLAVFRRGDITNPSVDRVIRLYEYLSNNTLEVL